MKPNIYIGADHAGFDMKTLITEHLESQGYNIEDLGAFQFDPNDDYPQYGSAVAQAVQNDKNALGILSCGNAEGICITANKFENIRAGIGFSIKSAKTMRQDDDANIICIPGRIDIQNDPLEIINTFLSTSFSQAERHIRRIKQIINIKKNTKSHNFSVIPAILAHSFNDFKTEISNPDIRKIADIYHIDILDGSMFESTCWSDVEKITTIKPLPMIELHLMIKDPLPIIELWHKNIPTLKRIIIHSEIHQDIPALLYKIRKLKLNIGIAINPDTKIEDMKYLLKNVNFIQVMGVFPGISGQKFLGKPIINKIKQLKKSYPDLRISVDGGVTLENIKQIKKAGAHQICSSSTIWNSINPSETFNKLQQL